MSDQKSDEMGRLAFIHSLISSSQSGVSDAQLLVGVEAMDDAALVRVSPTESLVVANDFIRGSGFYLFEIGLMNYFDVGYYLVAANISDIAAMGAVPYGITSVFRYRKDVTDDEFVLFFRGIIEACDDLGIKILGGDIGSYVSDVFSATAIGFVESDKALLRSGAKPRDLLCVTGDIGLPITALTYFLKAKPKGFTLNPEQEARLLESWRRPKPRVQEGIILSRNKLAHSCMDVSDGLKASIEQMSVLSNCTFDIYSEYLPITDITYQVADYMDSDPVKLALSASVDFELLFSIEPGDEDILREKFDASGAVFSVIGGVGTSKSNTLIRPDGTEELPGIAWKHQDGDYIQDILGS